MCTVSWLLHDDGGFELFANRDERRVRLPAHSPALRTHRGVRLIAPTDADAGGTWAGVNEHGLAICLLNGAPRDDQEPPGGFTSRGVLVLDLLAEADAGAARARLQTVDLTPYRGFRVLLLGRGVMPVTIDWDGHRRKVEFAAPPLVSSTLDRTRATECRRAAWPTGELTRNVLLAYHRSHRPERGPWSVCMHREDARTVSFSHVSVSPKTALFRYAPAPPCRTALGAPIALALRAPPVMPE